MKELTRQVSPKLVPTLEPRKRTESSWTSRRDVGLRRRPDIGTGIIVHFALRIVVRDVFSRGDIIIIRTEGFLFLNRRKRLRRGVRAPDAGKQPPVRVRVQSQRRNAAWVAIRE